MCFSLEKNEPSHDQIAYRRVIVKATVRFKCSLRIRKNVWNKGKQGSVNDPKKEEKCGRKPKIFNEDLLRGITLNDHRRTVRSLAAQLNVSPSVIQRNIAKGNLMS
jgi:hypothetical protein